MELYSLLEKHVALKILHGDLSRKPELVERFLREAKAASKIRQENIIDITDFGVTEEGSVFFAMEYLEGVELHKALWEEHCSPIAGQVPPSQR